MKDFIDVLNNDRKYLPLSELSEIVYLVADCVLYSHTGAIVHGPAKPQCKHAVVN